MALVIATLASHCPLAFAAAQHGPITLKESDGKILIENDYWKLAIDPSIGGSIRSFVYKKTDQPREWIYPIKGGMLQDMIWQQRHPGELQEKKYEYKIVEQTPEKAVVELWRVFSGEPYPGLRLAKIISLSAVSAAINVETVLENPTDRQVFPGLWMQNRLWPGGNPDGVAVAVRPSYMGIRVGYFENARLTGSEFVRKPAAPWMMFFDRKTKEGMLWLTDFNYVQQFYNSLENRTIETFYDRVLIKPGGKWSVKSTFLPVKNVDNCFYADAQLFATGSTSGDDITFTFRPLDVAVEKATVTVIAEKSDQTEKLAEKTLELSNVQADAPGHVTVNVPGSSKAPVIITLKVETPSGVNSLEFMHYADGSYYSMQDSAISFRAKIPKKIKPELLEDRQVKLQKSDHLRVLHGLGIWGNMNKVNEVLGQIDPGLEVKETYFKSGVLGPELSWQPVLVDDLLGYDMVVMNNVGADSLGDAGEIAVEQYVKAGGKLLVCGGLYSLGNSRFNESVLGEVLPIEVSGPFDITPLGGFHALKSKTAAGDLGSVNWYQKPKAVKKSAVVHAEANGQPMLVSGNYGKGRVMVWLGTPMGKPSAKDVPYWNSPGWSDYLKSELTELLKP